MIARLVFALMFLTPLPVLSQTRGYTARACGFDLDDNGVYGEAADCGVCDGQGADQDGGQDGHQRDIDGDAVDEDEWYVNCGTGNDVNACTPGSPCLTLASVIGRVDGSGDGAEDIICFTGTCSEPANLGSMGDGVGTVGVDGTRTQTATGSETIDWLYPTDPQMLVGWDTDNDASYPPFDTDDTSIIDGAQAADQGLTTATDQDFLEAGHFEINNWGDDTTTGINIGAFGIAGNLSSYLYFHDIETDDINGGGNWRSRARGISPNTMTGTDVTPSEYIFFYNQLWADWGGYAFRGNCGDDDSVCGPWRIQKVSYTALGGGVNDGTTLVDIFGAWGSETRPIEFLDSVFDGNIENWSEPQSNCGGGADGSPEGLNPEACVASVKVINNSFRNLCYIYLLEDSGTCAFERQNDNIVIDRNDWVLDANASGWSGTMGVRVEDGDSNIQDAEFFDGISITNNTFQVATDDSVSCCITVTAHDDVTGAVTPDGTVTIAHNTFDVDPTGNLINLDPAGTPHVMNWIVFNNLFNDAGTGTQLRTDWADNGVVFTSDGNVFDPASTYVFDGGAADTTLAAWQSTLDTCTNHTCTGGDDNSTEACTATFVSATNLHLDTIDVCAINQAQTGSAYTTEDVDGDSRPQGAGWDVGSDEALIGTFGGSLGGGIGE